MTEGRVTGGSLCTFLEAKGGLASAHCAVPSNKFTTYKSQILQCVVQVGLDEAKFLGREDFLKMAKCGIGDEL